MPGPESGRELPLQPGQLIGEKYRVEHVLGIGGMGVVVAATHLHLHQRVAIKCMLPEAAADPEAVQRFLREARNAALLKSEHVARVLDVATLENGSPYIVMEFLDGMTADELIETQVLSIGEAVEYTTQVCEAVAEAHARGIIHRDLKLANLFLTSSTDKRALVKVIDFGLSRPIVAETRITKDMSLMGTPAYMSPEQLRSADDIDTRTDLWALGVVLFELLTGDLPFTGTAPEICSQVLSGAPRDPRELRPEIPAPLAAIIARCLQKDRDARFASVAELAEALDPYVPEGSTRAGDRVRRVQSEHVMAPTFKSSGSLDLSSKRTGVTWGSEELLGARQSYRGWLAVAGALTVIAFVIIFVALYGTRQREAPSTSAATSAPTGGAASASGGVTAMDPATLADPVATNVGTSDLADASTTASAIGSGSPRPQRNPRVPGGGGARPKVPKKDGLLDSR